MEFVKLHVGEKEVNQIRHQWENFQHHPNSDFEHFLLVCQLRREVSSPLALSIWKNEDCCAIVAGRIEETVIRPKIGYAKLPGKRVRSLEIIHEGILGNLGEEEAKLFIESVLALLKNGEIDVANIRTLRENSRELWTLLRERSCRVLGARNPKWSVHRELKLENEPYFLLKRMRSKHRGWIRRNQRKLVESFSDNIKWSWYSGNIDVPEVCHKMETVARTTYQRGLGAGFIDDEETRQRLRLFASRDQLRVMLLEVDGEPASFWYGIVYKQKFHAAATGYRPDMAKFEIGTLSLLTMVDYLVEEEVQNLDFGLGDAYYKKRFSTNAWKEADVKLFADTAKGRMVHYYIRSAEHLGRLLRGAAANLGVIGKIKKIWRQAVRPNSSK